MSDFTINDFGSLTNKAGKQVKIDLNKLKEFDENKDNVISKTELLKYVNSLKNDFDSTEIDKLFNAFDENSSCDIDSDEFTKYEQKIQMQETVNLYIKSISADTKLSSYSLEVRDELKNFMETYMLNYKGEVPKMVENFKSAVKTKYEEIKKKIKANSPEGIQDKVLDEIALSLKSTDSTTTEIGSLSETARKKLLNMLEKEANKFRIAYQGNNFEVDLSAHLKEYMLFSDAGTMKSASDTMIQKLNSFGLYISQNELGDVKEVVVEYLKEAINQGVTIQLKGKNIKTETSINSVLSMYTSGDELIADIKSAIEQLDTTTVLDKAKNAASLEENKMLSDVKGSSYEVNLSIIDFTKVDGRYFDGGEIYERGRGWEGSRDLAYDQGYAILNKDELKSQIRSQIKSMLKEKGISFDKIETLFENIYVQSIEDTLNAENMITGRGARGLSSKGKAYINVKTMLDTFITTFNKNISMAIDDINKSDKDMDLMDIDYSAAATDDNGNNLSVFGFEEDVVNAYKQGYDCTSIGDKKDYYNNLAERMAKNMRSQMIKKAKKICNVNGITFDEKVFDTIFNNAKEISKNQSVNTFEQRIIASINTQVSKFNVRTFLNTLTQTFKESYTTWVDSKKKSA